MRITFCILLVLAHVCLVQAQDRIILDESYDDWQFVSDRIEDSGDVSSGLDITALSISNDDQFLFMLLEFDREIQLSDDNLLGIYIDFDNDATSGFQQNGIGAELRYFPGDRQGFLKQGNAASIQVRHEDIGWIISPTVSSNTFEVAIRRSMTADGNAFLMGNEIRVMVVRPGAQTESVPNEVGGYAYEMSNTVPPPLPLELDRPPGTAFRFLTYNVLSDGLSDFSRQLAFKRILTGLNPDIIAFQEIYDRPPASTANTIESFLPSDAGQQWYFGGTEPDNQLMSRHPILEVEPVDGNTAFLLDLGSGQEMVVISAHLPCCNNEVERQGESDALVAFLRDLADGTGPFDVVPGTPIIVAGDMNFVGQNQQVHTLRTGDIVNESIYGPDYAPDWGLDPLIDAKPRTSALPFSYTWFSPNGSFPAGRLDYIFYTGSSLSTLNEYVLNSSSLDADIRAGLGIFENDTETASDHLPVVADFALFPTSAAIAIPDDVRIYPNPTSDFVMIEFDEAIHSSYEIQLFNQLGQLLQQPYSLEKNEKLVRISLETLPKGTYIITLNNDLYYTVHQVIKI